MESTKAYVLINASPGHALDVARRLQGAPGIVRADAITGDYDVVALVEGSDINAVGTMIVERIQNVQGVYKTITCLVVQSAS